MFSQKHWSPFQKVLLKSLGMPTSSARCSRGPGCPRRSCLSLSSCGTCHPTPPCGARHPWTRVSSWGSRGSRRTCVACRATWPCRPRHTGSPARSYRTNSSRGPCSTRSPIRPSSACSPRSTSGTCRSCCAYHIVSYIQRIDTSGRTCGTGCTSPTRWSFSTAGARGSCTTTIPFGPWNGDVCKTYNMVR